MAVHDIFVALEYGFGFQGCEIRARAGFRIALTPPVFTGQNTGQNPVFLLLIAECVNYRSKHLHAKRHGRYGAVTGAFFVENIALRNRPICAAKFCRPARCNPAFGVQNFVPSQQVFLGHVTTIQRTQMLRIVFVNKGPHFFAESHVFWRKIYIHNNTPWYLHER